MHSEIHRLCQTSQKEYLEKVRHMPQVRVHGVMIIKLFYILICLL